MYAFFSTNRIFFFLFSISNHLFTLKGLRTEGKCWSLGYIIIIVFCFNTKELCMIYTFILVHF